VLRQASLKAKNQGGIVSAAASVNKMFTPAEPASVAIHVTLASVPI
jgi:hypothetical protein